jgi:hypothetical protein
VGQQPEISLLVGERVVLRSFLGTQNPTGRVRDGENYWLLINSAGVVVSTEAMSNIGPHERGQRVLVQFDKDVTELGLHCHNEKPNSLWIFVSDLCAVP